MLVSFFFLLLGSQGMLASVGLRHILLSLSRHGFVLPRCVNLELRGIWWTFLLGFSLRLSPPPEVPAKFRGIFRFFLISRAL